MEKSTENKNKNNFLKEDTLGDISKHHKKFLGTDIPEDYFIKSKISILDKIKEESLVVENKAVIKKQKVLWLQPQFRFIAAASVVALLALTIWLKYANQNIIEEKPTFELLSFSDDVLINSLLVDDTQLEAFTDATLINEVVIKAEIDEQQMDNLFINSLFVEDSLIDGYTEDSFLETIIL